MSLAVAHVGAVVGDLDRALRFYGAAFGCTALQGPIAVPAGDQVRDVLGPGVGDFRQAHVRTPGGAIVELFEFARPVAYAGFFHICLLEPDIERRAALIAEAGGRRLSRIWPHRPGGDSLLCYCADPFGNRIELSTHHDEDIYSP